MKTQKNLRRLFSVLTSSLLLVSQASAVDYYWDTNTITSGLGDNSLIWGNTNTKGNLSGPNNRTVISGTFSMDNTATTTSDKMYFGIAGMSLGTTGSLVGIQSSGVSINQIIFSSSQLNPITLGTTGNLGAITLGGATPTFHVNNAANTITTTLAGTVGMTVSGPGKLTLNAASVNSLTGGITLNNGSTLIADFANLATPNNLIDSSNTLTLTAGNFLIKGKSTGSTTQTLGNLTINAGASSILINPNAGTGTILNLGTLTTSAAGGSLILGTSASAGSGAVTITTTTDKSATTGIYSGRMVFTSDGGTTVDWVTTASGSSPYTLSAYSSYTALDSSGGTATTNYSTSAGGILSGALSANTLKIIGSSTDLVLGANTLTLASGGLLSTGSTAQNITGIAGTTHITTGNGSGSYDLIVHQYNSAGLNIDAVIGNNGGNAVNLVKSGTETLTLSGTNTYSGTTYVNAGILAVSGGSAIADGGTVSMANSAGAEFRLIDNETITAITGGGLAGGNVNVQSRTLTLGGTNTSMTYNGLLTGNSDGKIIKTGSGKLTLNTFYHTNGNAFAGTITVSGGTLNFTTGNNGQSSIAVSSGGTIELANSTTLEILAAINSPYTWNGQIGAIPTATYSFSNAIKLTGAGATISLTGANDTRYTFSGNVTGSDSGNSTFTINPTVNSDRTEFLFSGVLADGNSGNTLGLTVNLKSLANNSYLSLTGKNTFNGPIVVTTTSSLANSGYLTIGGQSFTSGSTGTVRNNAIVGNGYIGGGNFTGTISLGSNTVLNYLSTENQILAGVISGAGSVLKEGGGILSLAGANTYSGTTTLTTGTLNINNSGSGGTSSAIGTGTLVINAGTTIDNTSGSSVTLSTNNAQTWNGDFTFTGTNDLNMGAGTATINANRQVTVTASTLSVGGIAESGGTLRTLTKLGNGVLAIQGTSSYTGATTVSAGKLVVNGSIATSSLTTVQSGATIGGSGTIGALTISSGGFINPGNSPGILTVSGNYTQDGQLNFEAEGLTAGNGAGNHDQIVVNGTVTLGAGSTLNIASFAGFTPANSSLLFILLNDGTDAISGTFSGLAQGASVGTYLGYDWKISYVADSGTSAFTGGNDIALQAYVIPEPKAALMGALGVLLLFRRRR